MFLVACAHDEVGAGLRLQKVAVDAADVAFAVWYKAQSQKAIDAAKGLADANERKATYEAAMARAAAAYEQWRAALGQVQVAQRVAYTVYVTGSKTDVLASLKKLREVVEELLAIGKAAGFDPPLEIREALALLKAVGG